MFLCSFIFHLYHFYAPAIFNGGGGAYSITVVRMSVRPVRNTNGFRSISFEKISEYTQVCDHKM